MSVHIALIGKTREPVLKGFQHYGSIKRLYLLHSADDKDFKFEATARDVEQRLKAIGFHQVSFCKIDAFDMNSVIDAIISIVDKERLPVYINITGGTNLMAGAACSAAFFVGAKAYYVLGKKGADIAESKVIELPVPNIPYYRVLQRTQLMILRSISELGGVHVLSKRFNSSVRYDGQMVRWDTIIEQKAAELGRCLIGGICSLDFSEPSPNLSRPDNMRVRRRILSLTQSEAAERGIGRSTLHYLRKNAKSRGSFAIRRKLREKIGQKPLERDTESDSETTWQAEYQRYTKRDPFRS